MTPHRRSLVPRVLHRVGRELTRLAETLEVSAVARATVDSEVQFDRCTCYHTDHGRFVIPDYPKQDVIANCIRANDVFDEPIVNEALRCLRPGDSVIDVGANFGQFSIILAQHVGAMGRVIAIEADPFVCSILRKNVELNKLENVTVVEAAAHEVSGLNLAFPQPDFKVFHTYGSYGIDPSSDSTRRVMSIRIDDLELTDPVRLMKVDVQGCDLFALRGAAQLIARNQMPIIFEYEEQFQERFNTSFQDYIDFVTSINYQFSRTLMGVNYVITPKSSPRLPASVAAGRAVVNAGLTG